MKTEKLITISVLVILVTGGMLSGIRNVDAESKNEEMNESIQKVGNLDSTTLEKARKALSNKEVRQILKEKQGIDGKSLNKVRRLLAKKKQYQKEYEPKASWLAILQGAVKCFNVGFNLLYEADKEVTNGVTYKQVKTEDITFADWNPVSQDGVYHVTKYMPAWKGQTISVHPHTLVAVPLDNVNVQLTYAWDTEIRTVDQASISHNQYLFTSVNHDLPKQGYNSDGLKITWSNDDWRTHELYQCSYTDNSGVGCPFVATWNGKEYKPENNILWKSERKLGARKTIDVKDRYLIDKPSVKNNQYSLQLQEFEHEISYIDQAKLMAVDHPENTEVAVTQKGKIVTYEGTLRPNSVKTTLDTQMMNTLSSKEDQWIKVNAGDEITLNYTQTLKKSTRMDSMRILLVNISAKKSVPDIKVYTGETWTEVDSILPRANGGIQAIDLTNSTGQNQIQKVEMKFNGKHKISQIGLADLTDAPYSIQKCSLANNLQSSNRKLYNDLLRDDQKYVSLKPGDKINLNYQIPDRTHMDRDLMLVSDGFYTRYIPAEHSIDGVAMEHLSNGTLYTPMLDSYSNIKKIKWIFSDGTTSRAFQPCHETNDTDGLRKRIGMSRGMLIVNYKNDESKIIRFTEG